MLNFLFTVSDRLTWWVQYAKDTHHISLDAVA